MKVKPIRELGLYLEAYPCLKASKQGRDVVGLCFRQESLAAMQVERPVG
jgi:hypothetical protein